MITSAIINRPIGLINLIEYQDHEPGLKIDKVFVVTDAASETQIRNLLNFYRHFTTEVLYFRKDDDVNAFRFYRELRRFFMQTGAQSDTVIGIGGLVFRLAIKCFKPRKVVFLDEGNTTLNRIKINFAEIDPRSFKEKIRDLILRIDFYDPTRYPIHYFYSYANQGLKNYSFNSYAWHKKQLSNKSHPAKTLWFVGGNQRSVFNDREEYLDLLGKLFNAIPEVSITYIAHRLETDQDLHDISQRFRNIRTTRFQYPVEIELINYNYVPAVVIGTYSTALLNIHKIFGDDVQLLSIRIPGEMLKSNYAHRLDLIYHELTGNDIAVCSSGEALQKLLVILAT